MAGALNDLNSEEGISSQSDGASKRPNYQRSRSRVALDYVRTLVYGRYTKDLGDYARKEAATLHENERGFRQYETSRCPRCRAFCLGVREITAKVVAKMGEDWVFLAILGISMALLSFLMDFLIEKCQEARLWLYDLSKISVALQYFTWILFPLIFLLFSVGFTHLVAPQAIGSGIPEMKTILRGVVLKEYLTMRTLISKMIGLMTALGSGLPIGKEGPFVHIASVVATQLGKLFTTLKGSYDNESRKGEMLSAAAAVGVACTFAAPIGGVLFSIEVTATYFAVRNYWRGFFAAVCGAVMFRLFAIWFKSEETLTALFKTNLRQDFPFDTIELVAFSTIGIVCGFAGALFVFIHRKIATFTRNQKRIATFLQKNRFIYPMLVTFVISSLTFPNGFGQFMAGHLTSRGAVNDLFSNFTWSSAKVRSAEEAEIINHWKPENSNIYVTLALFVLMRFWMSATCNSLPIPAGIFMPVFVLGAGFGRLVGECMATWFPNGVRQGDTFSEIVPGGYAIVGAAAFAGAVTHTVSTSVIVFELTGQLGHVLPAVIAVLLANAVAQSLQPSFYDSVIQIRKLPFLPDIKSSASNAHKIFVEDIMIRDVKLLSAKSTYKDIKNLLHKATHRSFPVVDSPESMVLLGSIPRIELCRLLDWLLGWQRRQIAKKEMLQDGNRSRTSSRFEVTPSNGSGDQAVVDVHSHSSNGKNLTVADTSQNRSSSKSGRSSPFSNLFSGPPEDEQASPDPALEMTADEQERWEDEQLNQTIDLDMCQVDPAPFQLVERTSLYKVHSLFSLLGLSHAYVTNTGRLVGVIALREVRLAVQGNMSPTVEGDENLEPKEHHTDSHVPGEFQLDVRDSSA
ncbi:unnamed protein product [Owenia fusiformis]|uniref:CBS domain-containing protein n=1 Tax=Owenia fusiformis TaxID=6347 RepID=A0A8S4MXJ4_OWEFU|nr:unnamed protein product [Owenia fusiformis]